MIQFQIRKIQDIILGVNLIISAFVLKRKHISRIILAPNTYLNVCYFRRQKRSKRFFFPPNG